MFSSFASLVFWGQPAAQLYELLRTHFTIVRPVGLQVCSSPLYGGSFCLVPFALGLALPFDGMHCLGPCLWPHLMTFKNGIHGMLYLPISLMAPLVLLLLTASCGMLGIVISPTSLPICTAVCTVALTALR